MGNAVTQASDHNRRNRSSLTRHQNDSYQDHSAADDKARCQRLIEQECAEQHTEDWRQKREHTKLGAVVLVGLLLHWRGGRNRDLRTHGVAGILVGLGFTFEFVFVAWGLTYTLASHMSVFLYTAPVFAALGLHFLVPGEQLARRQRCS